MRVELNMNNCYFYVDLFSFVSGFYS